MTTTQTQPQAKYPKLKACLRCHGDLFLDSDASGESEYCLQCGYRRQLVTNTALKVTSGVRQ